MRVVVGVSPQARESDWGVGGRGGIATAVALYFSGSFPSSHDLTRRSCGRYLVGQVVEEGSHEDLLSNKGGVYSGLVKRQLDLGEDADKEDIGRSTPGPSAIARSRKSLSKAGSKRRSTRMSSCDASSSSEVEG